MVSLKYLNKFCRTLGMSLINCEINLQLTFLKKVFWQLVLQQINYQNLTDTRFYGSVVTLSTQDNIKLLKQLESGFKRRINCNKDHSKKASQAYNIYKCFN